MLKEAVTAFNKFASKDSSTGIIEFLKEENERSRQHEMTMLGMQMHMFQTMMAGFESENLLQGHVSPQHVTFNPRQCLSINTQPRTFENLPCSDDS